MAVKWHKTKYPGIRYREHPTRKHGVKRDRYFSIYYRLNKKNREEGLGWASQGWDLQKAVETLAELKQNQRLSSGPQTLAEKHLLEQQRREQEEKERLKKKIQQCTFHQLAQEYIKWAQANKKSWKDDEQRYNFHLRPALGDKLVMTT